MPFGYPANFQIPAAPLPENPADSARWDACRLRERLMNGTWQDDLRRELEIQLGKTRSHATGSTDMSSCLLRNIAVQLGVLYDKPPSVSHLDGAEGLIGPQGLIADAGLWSLMGGVQQLTIAMNEYLVAVSISPTGEPLFRPVSPGYVVATAAPGTDEPETIRELRLRTDPTTRELGWFWDVWEPKERRFSVQASKDGTYTDCTALFITDANGAPVPGPLEGDDYPYLTPEGAGIMPWGFWHATRTGKLWNTTLNETVTTATLTAAVFWNFFGHCLRDASYPQRYAINCHLPGTGLEDADVAVRETIVTDPSTILMMTQDDDGQQPQIGQWLAGADASMILGCLEQYESRVASSAGISASDVQRLSGQARSGYAISMTNSGKRAAQAKYSPTQRRGDLALIATTAQMLNSVTGSTWPTSGYSIRYAAVPKSAQELEAERKHVLELLDAGLMDRAEALSMLTGMTRAEALQRLEEIRRLNISTAA